MTNAAAKVSAIGWLCPQSRAGMCCALFLLANAVFAQTGSLTTQHNDNQRTGLNPLESTLQPANTQWGTFGRIFTGPWVINGYLHTQPLFVPGVPIQGKSTNVLLLLADSGTLYVYGVNTPSQPQLIYPPILLEPNDVVLRAISTPVVDASKNLLYVIYRYVQQGSADCTQDCRVSCLPGRCPRNRRYKWQQSIDLVWSEALTSRLRNGVPAHDSGKPRSLPDRRKTE